MTVKCPSPLNYFETLHQNCTTATGNSMASSYHAQSLGFEDYLKAVFGPISDRYESTGLIALSFISETHNTLRCALGLLVSTRLIYVNMKAYEETYVAKGATGEFEIF